MKGSFIVITGPSASGKTTLVKALLEKMDDAARLPTMTTRAPRPAERNGVDYFFTDRADFEKRLAGGEFFEYAEVYGNLYGSSKAVLDEYLSKHRHVLSIVDVKGAKTLKKMLPHAFVIFVRPGSPADVERRLLGERKEIPKAELDARIKAVEEELKEADHFDAVVDNKEGLFNATVEQVRAIVDGVRSEKGSA